MRLLRSFAVGLLLALAVTSIAWGDNAPPRFVAFAWREPVATLEDLPAGEGSLNELGDCRLVRESGDRGIYCWFNEWVAMALAVPDGGYATLSGDNTFSGENGFSTLSSGGGFTWEVTGDGTDGTFKFGAGNVFGLDLDNTGAREFYADNVKIYTTLPFGIIRSATLPTCDSTLAPAGVTVLAYDTTGPDLCMCNGSAWAPVDGSGTCA